MPSESWYSAAKTIRFEAMAITSALVVKKVGITLRIVMKTSAARAFHASTRWYDALAASDSWLMSRAP